MNRGMPLVMTVDPKTLWALTKRANAAGVTPAVLMATIIAAEFTPGKTVQDRVADLVCAGLSDGEIAARMQYSNGTVAKIRRGLGLKPNRRKGR